MVGSLVFDESRFRISAKQTAKNLWQIDGTVENKEENFNESNNPEDLGVLTPVSVGKKLLKMIKDTEDEFRKDGRKLVGDEQ